MILKDVGGESFLKEQSKILNEQNFDRVRTMEEDKMSLEIMKLRITEIYRKLLSKNTAQNKLELYESQMKGMNEQLEELNLEIKRLLSRNRELSSKIESDQSLSETKYGQDLKLI